MSGRIAWIAAVVVFALCGPSSAQDAARVERGAKLFVDQKCTLCHSVADKGQKKGPLDGVGSKLTADEIRLWLVSPAEMTTKTKAARKPVMKSYASLKKEDVDALVAYVQSLKK